MQFLMLLRQHFPQFAQQARGKFMQQDAEEFMGALFGSLAQARACVCGRMMVAWVCCVGSGLPIAAAEASLLTLSPTRDGNIHNRR